MIRKIPGRVTFCVCLTRLYRNVSTSIFYFIIPWRTKLTKADGERGVKSPRMNFATTKGFTTTHRGAGKSLARSGRKQSTATEDFEFRISYLSS
jgi:hypothetical protein